MTTNLTTERVTELRDAHLNPRYARNDWNQQDHDIAAALTELLAARLTIAQHVEGGEARAALELGAIRSWFRQTSRSDEEIVSFIEERLVALRAERPASAPPPESRDEFEHLMSDLVNAGIAYANGNGVTTTPNLIERCKSKMRALVQPPESSALVAAAQDLVTQIDAAHAHPAYQGVWTLYHIHGGRYEGLTYSYQLERLRTALAESGAAGTAGISQLHDRMASWLTQSAPTVGSSSIGQDAVMPTHAIIIDGPRRDYDFASFCETHCNDAEDFASEWICEMIDALEDGEDASVKVSCKKWEDGVDICATCERKASNPPQPQPEGPGKP